MASFYEVTIRSAPVGNVWMFLPSKVGQMRKSENCLGFQHCQVKERIHV